MDWQVLAVLAISGVSLIAFFLMGSGSKPARKQVDDVPRVYVAPPTPAPEPTNRTVDPALLERFNAALRDAAKTRTTAR